MQLSSLANTGWRSEKYLKTTKQWTNIAIINLMKLYLKLEKFRYSIPRSLIKNPYMGLI